jgi:hypothetical protein
MKNKLKDKDKLMRHSRDKRCKNKLKQRAKSQHFSREMNLLYKPKGSYKSKSKNKRVQTKIGESKNMRLTKICNRS